MCNHLASRVKRRYYCVLKCGYEHDRAERNSLRPAEHRWQQKETRQNQIMIRCSTHDYCGSFYRVLIPSAQNRQSEDSCWQKAELGTVKRCLPSAAAPWSHRMNNDNIENKNKIRSHTTSKTQSMALGHYSEYNAKLVSSTCFTRANGFFFFLFFIYGSDFIWRNFIFG